MQKITINSAKIHISTDTIIFDSGEQSTVHISVARGIVVKYCLISSLAGEFFRHVDIDTDSEFTGTAIVIHSGVRLSIVTNIVGDNTKSHLSLLAIARDNMILAVEGVARVDSPYRHVSTRVDQTNILLGNGARVSAIPRLEIATDDIEGGHSCKVHRLGGDAAFYLESRGLSKENAEALLLNSEILKHLETIDDNEEKKRICFGIHKKLLEKI